VEAYGSVDDPASHAARGMTLRNRTMFGPPGYLYVYISYGIHICANVVVGPAGVASAVLLRAGELESGEDLARGRRGDPAARIGIASGPGRLGSALGLQIGDDGANLLESGEVHLLPPSRPPTSIESGHRVGITRATSRAWRFWERGNSEVSRFRRGLRE
jgi:DNA-3-methyladenine glycosylase